jgi:diadenylate cyclase
MLNTLWSWQESVSSPVGWRGAVDITLMACLVYQVYIRFRGTRAARIGVGLAIMGSLYFLAHAAGLLLTSWVLSGVWAVAFVLVIIVFQSEIRQVLEQVQPAFPSLTLFHRGRQFHSKVEILRMIADTCFALAPKRLGMLLMFERRDQLEPLLRSIGVIVDAQVSPRLLENLFTPPAPLHDGALYLRGERIFRAAFLWHASSRRRGRH